MDVNNAAAMEANIAETVATVETNQDDGIDPQGTGHTIGEEIFID